MTHIFNEIEREGYRQIKNIDVFSRNERKGKRKKEREKEREREKEVEREKGKNIKSNEITNKVIYTK